MENRDLQTAPDHQLVRGPTGSGAKIPDGKHISWYTRWSRWYIRQCKVSAESNKGSFSFWRWRGWVIGMSHRWWVIGMSHYCCGSTGQGYHRSISLVVVRLKLEIRFLVLDINRLALVWRHNLWVIPEKDSVGYTLVGFGDGDPYEYQAQLSSKFLFALSLG